MVMVSFVVKLPESMFRDIIGYLLGTTENVKLLSITIFNIQFLNVALCSLNKNIVYSSLSYLFIFRVHLFFKSENFNP